MPGIGLGSIGIGVGLIFQTATRLRVTIGGQTYNFEISGNYYLLRVEGQPYLFTKTDFIAWQNGAAMAGWSWDKRCLLVLTPDLGAQTFTIDGSDYDLLAAQHETVDGGTAVDLAEGTAVEPANVRRWVAEVSAASDPVPWVTIKNYPEPIGPITSATTNGAEIEVIAYG